MRKTIPFLCAILFFAFNSGAQDICGNHHIQIETGGISCYGSRNGYLYLSGDTGTCSVCNNNNGTFFISSATLLDSLGNVIEGYSGEWGNLYGGTYHLNAVMSCHSALNYDSLITIDSIDESIQIVQPPFPYLTNLVVDTPKICFKGSISGILNFASHYCGYAGLQRKANGMYDDPGYIYVYTDSLVSWAVSNGYYRTIVGVGTGSRKDTGDWIIINQCLPPSTGFTTKGITSTTAIPYWDPVYCYAERFRIQYRKQGTSRWLATNAFATSAHGGGKLSGLAPGTTYEWEVASICSYDPDILSAFSPIQTFTTKTTSDQDRNIETSGSQVMDLKIIPNPASGFVELDASDFYNDITITIYNEMGELVRTLFFPLKETGKLKIDVSQFVPGIYHVEANDGYFKGSATLVKQ